MKISKKHRVSTVKTERKIVEFDTIDSVKERKLPDGARKIIYDLIEVSDKTLISGCPSLPKADRENICIGVDSSKKLINALFHFKRDIANYL